MKSLIHLHPYVKELEQRCAGLVGENERMQATINSMGRYIKQLEELTGYLRDENKELKAHLSGRQP